MRLPVENQERAPVIAAGIFRMHDVDGAGKRIQTGGSAVADDGDDDVLGHAPVRAAQQRTDKRSLVGRWFQDARVLLSGALPGQRNERAETTKKSPRTRAGARESAIGGRPHGRRDVRAMRLPCGRCRLRGHQRAKRADSGFQGFPRMERSGHFCYPPPPPRMGEAGGRGVRRVQCRRPASVWSHGRAPSMCWGCGCKSNTVDGGLRRPVWAKCRGDKISYSVA